MRPFCVRAGVLSASLTTLFAVCGIVGGLTFRDEDLRPFLESALEDLHLRGPDARGRHVQGQVALGHTRLSVLDLTSAGEQPMFAAGGQLGITFNGEIYNFQDLRRQLQGAGYRFTTATDTEVLLHGYDAWGMEGLLKRADGMFAFGLVDYCNSRLFLARDPFGKKPLYYYRDDSCFLFCSDLRPIYRFKRPLLQLDEVSLDHYLMELCVPQPRTIWRQARQVPPATYLQVDLQSGEQRTVTYWSLPGGDWDRPPAAEAQRQLSSRLRDSIMKRTVADVPVGCFLSGGVDSGLVVALLSQSSSEPVRTFSVGIEGEENELPDARRVAQRYGTRHQEFMASSSWTEDLDWIVSRLGEPFADSSLLPSFYLCQAMRNQIKVVLSGDGGDELFGGYREYLRAYQTDRFLARYPPWARWFAVQADKIWARLVRRKGENLGSLWSYSRMDPAQRLDRQMGFALGQRHKLYNQGGLQALAGRAEEVLAQVWSQSQRGDCADSLMRASLRTRLLNDYLVKVDRASMLNSLEVRSPFLDRSLAEWAFRLHPQVRFGPGEQKWLLKNLAEQEIDAQIRLRPKRGFSVPVGQWLRGPLRERLQALTDPAGALGRLGLFRLSYVGSLLEEHCTQRRDHSHRLWSLLILALWLESLEA